ncbi:hypothetical protein ACQEVM_32060 [Streptomyces sp. CA-243310]|uniref:hypothetical protein n=1 Tax=Streptomyces sp. CA-243310 TaxID=3240056 RepID=UPI003D8B01D2
MGANRLTGLDAARGIAVLGMFAVHVGPTPHPSPGTARPGSPCTPGAAAHPCWRPSPANTPGHWPPGPDRGTWQYALRGSALRRGPLEWALRALTPPRRARRDGAEAGG